MIIGKVIGNVWATRKQESLNGLKLMIVQPFKYNEADSEYPIVCADSIGAGIGELVLVVGGSSARYACNGESRPVDATIVGIIDEVDLSGK